MINLLRLLSGRTASAPVARERLQILLAHERGLRGQPDLLGCCGRKSSPRCRGTSRSIRTRSSSGWTAGQHVSTLEVDIEVPNGFERSLAAAG